MDRQYLPAACRDALIEQAPEYQQQEEQESTPDAVVVLDRGVLRYSGEAMTATGTDPGFESAVSVAISG